MCGSSVGHISCHALAFCLVHVGLLMTDEGLQNEGTVIHRDHRVYTARVGSRCGKVLDCLPKKVSASGCWCLHHGGGAGTRGKVLW